MGRLLQEVMVVVRIAVGGRAHNVTTGIYLSHIQLPGGGQSGGVDKWKEAVERI